MAEYQAGQPEQVEVKRYDALAAAQHIPETVDRIVEQFDPQKFILFGSHAPVDVHRWSEIELVVFDEAVDTRERTFDITRLFREYSVATNGVRNRISTRTGRGRVLHEHAG
jgi:hypothetical protein